MPRRFAVVTKLAAVVVLSLATRPVIASEILAPNTSSFTLDNGLAVVVVEDHRSPVAYHMVWYKVGAADEPPGKSGIAHFLEHLMFKGTKDHPEGEFSVRIADVGGNENAFTAADYTSYFQVVAKQHLPMLMEFEADRMENLVLTEQDILTERDVILEERRSRTDNEPAAQLGEVLNASLYMNHPYGIPVIGWEHEMQALSLDDAISFYDRYYTPNNAIVVVAGDVTPDEVRSLAEATYGKVPRRAEPGSRQRPQEPPQLAARTIEMINATVTQPTLRREYLVPSYGNQGDSREALAIDLLSDILGNGPTSRLYRALVVDEKVATQASAGYHGVTLDDTSLTLYAVPRPDVTLDALTARIDAVIADIVKHGVTEDELKRSKHRMVADTIYAQDSIRSLARMFGAALATGETVEDVQTWPSKIESVSLDEVNAAARKYLDIRRSVTARLLGKAGEQRS